MRALKTIAMVNGRFEARERALMVAVAAVHGASDDVDTLTPIPPEALAAAITEPTDRERVILLMILMSMIDGDAGRDEAAAVERFAAALGADTPYVATLRKLAEGHALAVRLDLGRRVWVREHVQAMVRERGVMSAIAAVLTMLRIREDEPIASRYRALGTYPEGTVGRVYHDHMREQGFALPGERGSPPEAIVIHDLTHVLSGYGTDPDGEVCTAAFHAGNRKQDPFTFLFFVMMQFHLGVRMTPVAQAAQGHFDPAAVLRAVERGAAVVTDLTSGWDPWSVMDRPLDRVRADLGVPPL